MWKLNTVESPDTEFPFSALPFNDQPAIKRALKHFLLPEHSRKIAKILDEFSSSSTIDESMDGYVRYNLLFNNKRNNWNFINFFRKHS